MFRPSGETVMAHPSVPVEGEEVIPESVDLARGLVGTKVISISLCLLSLFADIPLLGATGRNPGHGTKVARGLDWVHKYWLLFIGFTPEFLSLCNSRIARGLVGTITNYDS